MPETKPVSHKLPTLEYSVGPAGSSDAVTGPACVIPVGVVIAVLIANF